MTSRKGILTIAALILLAFVCHAAMGSDANDNRTTTHAITVNAASLPDFDGDGTVGFSDFVILAGVFGARQGDEKYDARYDLNGDGEIGFSDFVTFAENFGKEVPSDDRAALVALYEATDGPNWTDKTNWLTDSDLSTWYGVTVSNGRVTKLELKENNLTGAIPPELGNLSSLDSLRLDVNRLSGAIPAELGNLENLEWLILFKNQLSGTIPVELGNLENLRSLYLHENQLSGAIPVELGNLENLTWLWLHENQLSGAIPVELGNLTNLTILSLSNNQLTGTLPQSLTRLTKLETFNFGGEGGLCAPLNAAFQTWLQGIKDASGPNCSGTTTPSVSPDMIVESPSVDDNTLTTGQSFTLRATVRNQGNASSASTTLRYYRSSDATTSSNDTEVGTDDVSSLSAGDTSAESISLNAPSDAGTYYYGCVCGCRDR